MVRFPPELYPGPGRELTVLPSLPTPAGTPRREARALEICITGVVQGVGFRPFVHRLAMRHGVTGWVRNEAGSVRILAEGEGTALAAFNEGLRREAPPLARIDRLETTEAARQGLGDFRVLLSDSASPGRLPVAPDVSVCPACAAEMRDPANRRFRYPFITKRKTKIHLLIRMIFITQISIGHFVAR